MISPYPKVQTSSIIFNTDEITQNSWWRHQTEAFSSSLALCEGNSPVSGEFSSQRPVTWPFDVFFDLRLNKLLSKQSRRRWFETPSCSLWRHCNADCWLSLCSGWMIDIAFVIAPHSWHHIHWSKSLPCVPRHRYIRDNVFHCTNKYSIHTFSNYASDMSANISNNDQSYV